MRSRHATQHLVATHSKPRSATKALCDECKTWLEDRLSVIDTVEKDEMYELRLQKGVDDGIKKCEDELAFLCACRIGNMDTVKSLVNDTEMDVNIHACENYALRCACEHGHLEVVKYLHEHGIDISIGYDAAYNLAILNGHLDVVDYLEKASK